MSRSSLSALVVSVVLLLSPSFVFAADEWSDYTPPAPKVQTPEKKAAPAPPSAKVVPAEVKPSHETKPNEVKHKPRVVVVKYPWNVRVALYWSPIRPYMTAYSGLNRSDISDAVAKAIHGTKYTHNPRHYSWVLKVKMDPNGGWRTDKLVPDTVDDMPGLYSRIHEPVRLTLENKAAGVRYHKRIMFNAYSAKGEVPSGSLRRFTRTIHEFLLHPSAD